MSHNNTVSFSQINVVSRVTNGLLRAIFIGAVSSSTLGKFSLRFVYTVVASLSPSLESGSTGLERGQDCLLRAISVMKGANDIRDGLIQTRRHIPEILKRRRHYEINDRRASF